MNVAILLKGGISKTTGRSNFPEQIYRDGAYVDFYATQVSIQEHIINPNPSYNFDFFIHTWHPDLEQQLCKLYKPVRCVFESNIKYRDEISEKLSSANMPPENFSQASHCLSISKGCRLVKDYAEETNKHYDLVILYRLDLLLWKDMALSLYDVVNTNTIYVNSFDERKGDFHFVMNYEDMVQMCGLYDSISLENPPVPHEVIKKYVLTYMKKNLVMDFIHAGVDQEIIRKLKFHVGKFDPTRYGLNVSEFLSYEIGKF